MTGCKLPVITILKRENFRDDGLYIWSPQNGKLSINADTNMNIDAGKDTLYVGANTAISIDGNTTISGANSLSLGAGALTIGGNVTVAANKPFTFSTGYSSLRFPNDSIIASGGVSISGTTTKWTQPIVRDGACGFLRVKLMKGAEWSSSRTFYLPMFSSNAPVAPAGV